MNTGVANAGCDSTGVGGIRDITYPDNPAIAALNGYSASINVNNATLPEVAAGDALLIAVTVTGPDGVGVVVEGIRTRYAPRMLP